MTEKRRRIRTLRPHQMNRAKFQFQTRALIGLPFRQVKGNRTCIFSRIPSTAVIFTRNKRLTQLETQTNTSSAADVPPKTTLPRIILYAETIRLTVRFIECFLVLLARCCKQLYSNLVGAR